MKLVSCSLLVFLWYYHFLENGEIQQLMALQDADDYVCSVKFTREGNCVAVGTPQGIVELWDVGAMKKVKLKVLEYFLFDVGQWYIMSLSYSFGIMILN